MLISPTQLLIPQRSWANYIVMEMLPASRYNISKIKNCFLSPFFLKSENLIQFQLTAIVNYGQRLQHPYIQKVIELYELKPSHFNSTEEIFCDVFVCPTTTTVTEKVTTPTSTSTTITTTSTTIPTTETTVPTTETTVSTTTNIPTTTVLIPLIDERDLVGSESSQTTSDVSDDQVATIAMLVTDSVPVTTSTSTTTTTMSTTATDASTTTTISTTAATAIPTPVPVSSAPSSAVPNTFLVVMSINFIMNCLLHF